MIRSVRCAAAAALIACLPATIAAEPVALIIGIEDYESFRNVPRADEVDRLGREFSGAGIQTFAFSDTDGPRLRGAFLRFAEEARTGDGAVVYLAGRFVHSATDTYFLSSGAEVSSLESLRREALPLSMITAVLATKPGRSVLALGDASPFALDVPYLESGIGDVSAPQGVTILSGQPSEMRGFLRQIVTGEAVLTEAALGAAEIRSSGFLPWNGRLMLSDDTVPAPQPEPDPNAEESAYWDAVRNLDTIEGYENYLNRYGGGLFAAEARQRIAALRDAPRREAEEAERALGLTRDQRRQVQRALTILDFNPRGIDGIFGRGTRGAISAFQESQGYTVTGYLDREQLRRLDRLARDRSAELEAEARREAERAAEADRDYWDRTGASGREDDLRRYLERYPEGIFANRARRDLREIQEARRPDASAVEDLTWQRVEDNGSIAAYQEYLRRYPDGTYAETARQEIERLEDEARREAGNEEAERREQAMNLSVATRRTIEQRLAELDYEPGRVDGTFDRDTRIALQRYQRDRRLPATGYMNDPTMVRILADTVISIFD